FSATEATNQGLALRNDPSLFIIPNAYVAQATGLVSYLLTQGIDVVVSKQMSSKFDGSQKLSSYSAVLHFGDDYNGDMPSSGQSALLRYVGGGATYIGLDPNLSYFIGDRFFRQMSQLMFSVNFLTNHPCMAFYPSPEQTSHPVLYEFSGVRSTSMYCTGVE